MGIHCLWVSVRGKGETALAWELGMPVPVPGLPFCGLWSKSHHLGFLICVTWGLDNYTMAKVTFGSVSDILRNQIFSLSITTFLNDGINVKGKQKWLFPKRMEVPCLILYFPVSLWFERLMNHDVLCKPSCWTEKFLVVFIWLFIIDRF